MRETTLFVGPLDRLLYLRSLPALDRLASSQLAAIAQYAREEFFAKGSALLSSEAPVEAFYTVVQGRVAAARAGIRQPEAGPAESVGLLDLLARAETGLDAWAEADTLALRIEWDDHVELCERNFPILLHYLGYLSARTIEELQRAPAGWQLGDAATAAPAVAHRLDAVERVLALARCAVLPSTAVEAMGELSRHLDEVRIGEGERLWVRGDPADHVLLLVTGRVRCETAAPGRWLGAVPGAALGLHETLTAAPRWYDAIAERPVAALRMGLEPFLDIMEDHFDLAIDFTSILARDLLGLTVRPGA